MKTNKTIKSKEKGKRQNSKQANINQLTKKLIYQGISSKEQIKPFKLLQNLKQILSLLPASSGQYEIQAQGQYLIKLGQFHQILTLRTKQNKKVITSQFLFKLIDTEIQLNQLLQIFNNLTEHKEIVVAIWFEIFGRVMDYLVGIMILLGKRNKQKQKQQSQKDISSELPKCLQFLKFIDKNIFESIEFLLEFECGIQSFAKVNKQNVQQIMKLESKGQQSQLSQKESHNMKQIQRSCQLINRRYEWVGKVLEKFIQESLQKIKAINKSNSFAKKEKQINSMSLITLLKAIKQFSLMIDRYTLVINKLKRGD